MTLDIWATMTTPPTPTPTEPEPTPPRFRYSTRSARDAASLPSRPPPEHPYISTYSPIPPWDGRLAQEAWKAYAQYGPGTVLSWQYEGRVWTALATDVMFDCFATALFPRSETFEAEADRLGLTPKELLALPDPAALADATVTKSSRLSHLEARILYDRRVSGQPGLLEKVRDILAFEASNRLGSDRSKHADPPPALATIRAVMQAYEKAIAIALVEDGLVDLPNLGVALRTAPTGTLADGSAAPADLGEFLARMAETRAPLLTGLSLDPNVRAEVYKSQSALGPYAQTGVPVVEVHAFGPEQIRATQAYEAEAASRLIALHAGRMAERFARGEGDLPLPVSPEPPRRLTVESRGFIAEPSPERGETCLQILAGLASKQYGIQEEPIDADPKIEAKKRAQVEIPLKRKLPFRNDRVYYDR